VVRHHQIEVAAGALVFPGRRVEEDDKAIAGRIAPEMPHGHYRIAGIRETFSPRFWPPRICPRWRELPANGSPFNRPAPCSMARNWEGWSRPSLLGWAMN